MTRGVKPFYHSPDDMQKDIEAYFKKFSPDEITITGLALHLGFTSRQALINYEEKPDFVDTIKRAKLRVENSYELSLRKNGRAGDIFALKNFDWKDKTESEISTPPGRPFEVKSEKDIDARIAELAGKAGIALPAGGKEKPDSEE